MNNAICYIAHHTNSTNGWGRVGRMVIAAAKQQNLPHTLLAHQKSFSLQTLSTPVADVRFKLAHSYLDAARHYKKLKTTRVIHCLTEPMIPFALAAHRIQGIPLVISLYGTYAIKSLNGKLAETYRKAYGRAAALILPSQYTAEQLLSYCPELKSKIHIIPLASCFAAQNQTPSFQNRLAAAIFVGEIKKRKGVLPLLEAAKIAIQSGTLKTLYLVGTVKDESYYQQLLSYIQQERLGAHIIFTGQLSDEELSQLYAQCRVSVLPSIAEANSFEGFGLVHLESFAHATPSIGCRSSGSEAAIKDGHNGWLVAPMKTEQMANALIKVVGNAAVWESLSQNCRSNLRSWNEVLDDYKNIYDAVAHV